MSANDTPVPAQTVEEAREALWSFIRQMVGDDGALAIKDNNGRGFTRYANALVDAVRAEADAKHGDVMGETWEAGRAMGRREARAATLAEVREKVEEVHWRSCEPEQNGYDWAIADVLAALAALEGQ